MASSVLERSCHVIGFVSGVALTLVAWAISNYRINVALEREQADTGSDPNFQPIRCQTCGFYRRYF